jgi:hypothetical protein
MTDTTSTVPTLEEMKRIVDDARMQEAAATATARAAKQQRLTDFFADPEVIAFEQKLDALLDIDGTVTHITGLKTCLFGLKQLV